MSLVDLERLVEEERWQDAYNLAIRLRRVNADVVPKRLVVAIRDAVEIDWPEIFASREKARKGRDNQNEGAKKKQG